jgi:hypothetical protein
MLKPMLYQWLPQGTNYCNYSDRQEKSGECQLPYYVFLQTDPDWYLIGFVGKQIVPAHLRRTTDEWESLGELLSILLLPQWLSNLLSVKLQKGSAKENQPEQTRTQGDCAGKESDSHFFLSANAPADARIERVIARSIRRVEPVVRNSPFDQDHLLPS